MQKAAPFTPYLGTPQVSMSREKGLPNGIAVNKIEISDQSYPTDRQHNGGAAAASYRNQYNCDSGIELLTQRRDFQKSQSPAGRNEGGGT